jgi:glycosyltransferase involved in cell wall biosynthesis
MCDVGIIPLPNIDWWRVSSPLKFIEYLAMGKPVIATRIPFHEANMQNNTCGVLIESNNPTVISDAIIYLYNNKKLLKDMGAKGRNVASLYSWDRLAEKFELFLKSLGN